MNYIFAAMLLIASIWGIASGNGGNVSSALLQSGLNTVELMMTVTGGMVLWSGIMAIAEKSGLTDILAGTVRPLLRIIMPELQKGSPAEKYVCMNVVANILGLGNAATPPGIKAMLAMAEKNRLPDGRPDNDMVTFALINTASVQLIPATVMTLRTAAGTELAADTEIILYFDAPVSPELETLPDLTGMRYDEARDALSYYGLYLTTHSGLVDPERQTVSSQSLPAGTPLRHGSVVEVTLIDSDEAMLGKY